MSIEDKIYKIVPIEGGLEAVWGIVWGKEPIEPKHEWVTDHLEAADIKTPPADPQLSYDSKYLHG